jgi:carbamoyltransferase
LTNILGITHPISANTAAVLLVDGRPVAMAEEERFLRVKHAPFKFPLDSINYCLDYAGISEADIDAIGIGFSRVKYVFLARLWQLVTSGQFGRIPRLYLRWMRWITLENKLKVLSKFSAPLHFVRHHLAHAASAFYASGFAEAIVLTLDGSGGQESGMVCLAKGNRLSPLASISDDHSWGMAWENVTTHLGFRAHSDEGKVMGLSAYGEPRSEGLPAVDWSCTIPAIDRRMLSRYLAGIPRREPGDPILQAHKDLAATLQLTTQKAMEKTLRRASEHTGIRSFCLAGGVALNCASNGRLAQLVFVEELFVQPASNDAGTALGAALYVHSQETCLRKQWRLEHLYTGPAFQEREIQRTIEETGISSFRRLRAMEEVAEVLAEGKIVGWFQGQMEFGPRALGNRSILADPRETKVRDRVNIVKGREPWRPLAPSILEEYLSEFVVGAIKEPYYMIVAYEASERAFREIPGTVHVDGTLRPQAVRAEHNPRYWELISTFHELTGVPAVLNTSFNLAGEPLVMNPEHAIGTFFRSGMDYLVLGDFLIWK